MNQCGVAHRFAHEAVSAPCARCLTIVAIAAAQWHATDPGALDRPVCDRCAQRDDAGGYARLLAWRRMSRPARNAA